MDSFISEGVPPTVLPGTKLSHSVYHSSLRNCLGKRSFVYLSLALFNGLSVYSIVLVPIWNCFHLFEFMSWCLVKQILPDVSFSWMPKLFLSFVSLHVHSRICSLNSKVGMKGGVWGLGFRFGLHSIYGPIWMDLTTLY